MNHRIRRIPIRTFRRPLMLAGIAVALAVLALLLLPRPRDWQVGAIAAYDVPRVRVATPRLTETEIEIEIAGDAKILPRQEVDVEPEQAGWLRDLKAHKGQRVRAGEVLAMVRMLSSPPDGAVRAYEASVRHLRSAEEKYIAAERALARATADRTAAQMRTEAMETRLSQLRADLEKAEDGSKIAVEVLQKRSRGFDSRAELFDRGILPERELDQLEKARLEAASDENQARLTLQDIRAQVAEVAQQLEKEQEKANAGDQNVERARKAVEVERANVDRRMQRAQAQQARMAALAVGPTVPLTAPVDGVIVDIAARSGVLVTPGARLLRIKRSELAHAVFAPTDHNGVAISPGMPAVIRLGGDKAVLGKVVGAAPSADGGVHALLQAPDPGQALLPGEGMSASVNAGRRRVLVLPESAVTYDDGKAFVWVVDDGVAKRREVTALTIPHKSGDQLQHNVPPTSRATIISGLSEADLVVVESDRPLRDGTAVWIDE